MDWTLVEDPTQAVATPGSSVDLRQGPCKESESMGAWIHYLSKNTIVNFDFFYEIVYEEKLLKKVATMKSMAAEAPTAPILKVNWWPNQLKLTSGLIHTF